MRKTRIALVFFGALVAVFSGSYFSGRSSIREIGIALLEHQRSYRKKGFNHLPTALAKRYGDEYPTSGIAPGYAWVQYKSKRFGVQIFRDFTVRTTSDDAEWKVTSATRIMVPGWRFVCEWKQKPILIANAPAQ